MSFKEKKYEVWKEAISPDLASFCYRYMLTKKQTHDFFREQKYISPYEESHGMPTCEQIPNTFNIYCDVAMETLAQQFAPRLSKKVNMDLHHQYTFARVYKHGDELFRHKDRPACEISCTLNLGGDEWPIFIDGSGGYNNEGTKLILNPGDLLIYRGCDLEHWREPFEGDRVVQVFLHYNDRNGPFKDSCDRYDAKPLPALPAYFRDPSFIK